MFVTFKNFTPYPNIPKKLEFLMSKYENGFKNKNTGILMLSLKSAFWARNNSVIVINYWHIIIAYVCKCH